MDKVWIIENFLSKDECDEILFQNKDTVFKPATVYSDNMDEQNIYNARKSSISVIKNIPYIDNLLKNKLEEIIHIKGYNVNGLGLYQFTKYKIGDHFNWHTDSSEGFFEERFASVVIQLNDTYEGGILEIKDDINLISCPKGIGNLFIFYSYLSHRVTPITSGVRYSLVNWVSLNSQLICKKTLI